MREKGWIWTIVAVIALLGAFSQETAIYTFGLTAPTIILDAGHGGIDGGAVGPGGQIEKNINLAITHCLRELLCSAGYSVVLTREGDNSMGRGSTIKGQKTSDILVRAELAEKYPDALFISIHQNSFSDPAEWGAQAFWGLQNTQSQAIAVCVQQQLVEQLAPDNRRVAKAGEQSVYLLKTLNNPTVLVECGFISNPTEAEKLSDSTYQQQVAYAIFCGIEHWYGSEREDPA